MSGRAVYGIVAREFLRFLRQRGRVLASIGRPFVWLLFAGAGFATVFAGRNEIDYRVYMAPGLLGMVVMFGSLLAALSTVTDREAGVLRMVLVAPIRRSTVALGKTLGATALGTTQAVAEVERAAAAGAAPDEWTYRAAPASRALAAKG